jgi:hypothetical protein
MPKGFEGVAQGEPITDHPFYAEPGPLGELCQADPGVTANMPCGLVMRAKGTVPRRDAEKQPTRGSHKLPPFAEGAFVVFDVLEDLECADQVETRLGFEVGGCAMNDHSVVPGCAHAAACDRRRLGVEIESCVLVVPRESCCNGSNADTNFKHAAHAL